MAFNYEELARNNPGVDVATLREADAQRDALKMAGVELASSYSIDPTFGAVSRVFPRPSASTALLHGAPVGSDARLTARHTRTGGQ